MSADLLPLFRAEVSASRANDKSSRRVVARPRRPSATSDMIAAADYASCATYAPSCLLFALSSHSVRGRYPWAWCTYLVLPLCGWSVVGNLPGTGCLPDDGEVTVDSPFIYQGVSPEPRLGKVHIDVC